MKKNINNNNNLLILKNKINSKYKLLPFNTINNHIGATKYLPPVSKEWRNSIYVFNPHNVRNYPIYDININNLTSGYFNLRFDHEFIFDKYRPQWKKRLSMNKIYVSKADIKHTNGKAIITVFTFNKEKISLLKKIKSLRESLRVSLKRNFKSLLLLNNNNNFTIFFKNLSLFFKDKTLLTSFLLNNSSYLNGKYNFNKIKIKLILYYYIMFIRKYKLKINLNKYKFEENFLYKLSNLFSKFYNKKVTFNIVNMKSFVFNSDFFTNILTLKLKKRKIQTMRWIQFILNKAILPKVNRVKEKGIMKKSVNLDLLENKYKDLNIISSVQNNKLDNLLNELYYNVNLNKELIKNDNDLHEIIFNTIKYKNMGGIRLEVAGRLTKRYRADRALFKIKWKGGLKNIDSSFKKLSSVNLRGYVSPNLEYSLSASKRRVGSFAVKGWVSGK